MQTFIFLFGLLAAQAQPDSCGVRISLLTCSPGDALYSTFGHTAVRVTDYSAGTDLVYNYGTFEFSPDFYVQFIQGKLRYYLSVEPFSDFLYAYQWESRSVVEQVFLLTCTNRQALLQALRLNAQEENKYYLYDFLFDNCTTRPKGLLQSTLRDTIRWQNILPSERPTFRNLIHSYLDSGGQYWSKLGIDLLLGAKLDRQVTNQQAMFLPDYLLKGLNHASLNRQPLVTPPQPVLQMPSPLKGNAFLRPLVVFSLLLVAALVLYFVKMRWAKGILNVLERSVFFLAGVSGCILIYMWTGTDHVVTQNNYNILWALPTHLLAAFMLRSRKKWVTFYFQAAFVLHLLLLLGWAFWPQQLNIALIPIILLLAFSCWRHAKPFTHAGKTGNAST